jgi:predicted XRE-type DNA-binding protein
MTTFYIKKDRKVELDDALVVWFNFLGWCNSLFDIDDVKYLHSRGVFGFELLLFKLFIYPMVYIRKYGFSGVPFPFVFLKKKNKHKKDLVTKKSIKKKIKKVSKDANLADKVKVEKIEVLKVRLSTFVSKKKKVNKKKNEKSRLKRADKRYQDLSSGLKKTKDGTSSYRLLLFLLNEAKFSNDFTKFSSKFSFSSDFIATRSFGSLENIRVKDFMIYCIKHHVKLENIKDYFSSLRLLGCSSFVEKELVNYDVTLLNK